MFIPNRRTGVPKAMLTLEIDLLMTTDARLPLTDTEWRAAHQ
ncbi:hypothetical protein ACVBEH_15025 [Roseateles sp. GG27B]